MSQNDPIDEPLEPTLTEEDVRRRIDDWLKRLNDLFSEIESWATSNGWSVENRSPIPMQEELMRRYGIPERSQPTLSVQSPSGAEVWVKPKGLWVIGANGRVDIYSQNGVFTLIDIADALQPPQWILHRIGKGSGQPFDPSLLADMI